MKFGMVLSTTNDVGLPGRQVFTHIGSPLHIQTFCLRCCLTKLAFACLVRNRKGAVNPDMARPLTTAFTKNVPLYGSCGNPC